MIRLLLIASLLLLTGCGTAAKSPVGEEETPATAADKTDEIIARTATETAVAPRTAAEQSTAEARAAAKSVELKSEPDAKPAVKPAEPRPAAEIVALEPPEASAAPPASTATSTGKGAELVLQHIRLTVPDGWAAKKPDVPFLLAEYTLPRAAGDDADGRVTVTTAGGGVKQVVAMWREQFDGKPAKESQQELQILGMWASLVDMSGTYRTRPSQSAPFESHPDYRMLGAMCDVGDPKQMYFIKALGPAKTIAAHEKEFRAFVNSTKLKQ